jgi:phospholipase D1/2
MNTNASGGTLTNQGSVKRRRRATTKSRKGFSASDDLISREDAELLLSMVQGSLVVFPYDWLKAEEHNSNWLYQVDQVAPLQI